MEVGGQILNVWKHVHYTASQNGFALHTIPAN
jgi:hypothetical protein